MNEDLFLKYLRKDLKPYVKESDCCEGIVELRKENARLNNIIDELKRWVNVLSEKNKNLIEDNMRLRKEINLHSGKLVINELEVKEVWK